MTAAGTIFSCRKSAKATSPQQSQPSTRIATKPVSQPFRTSPSLHVSVNNVHIDVNAERILVREGGNVRFSEAFSPGEGHHSYNDYFVLHDPFGKIACDDASPITGDGKVISRLMSPDTGVVHARPDDFNLFPFFSEEPTTIGFLFATKSWNGAQSDQRLILIDTREDKIAKISTADCDLDVWLDRNEHPPAMMEKWSSAIGARALSFGYARRVTEVYMFKDGSYQPIPSLRVPIYEGIFHKAKLLPSELDLFRKIPLDEAYEQIDVGPAMRLLDLIFYGERLGRHKEVDSLIWSLHPSYQEALRYASWRPEVAD